MSQIYVSKNNSTYVPLASGSTFVGSADILTSYEEIDIIASGSPGNASGRLYFEFGTTPTNWEISVGLDFATPSSVPLILRAVLPHFRLRYENGAIPQDAFRLTTVFHKSAAMRLTRFLSQSIDPNEPVEVTRVAKSALPDGAASESTLLNLLSSSQGVQQVTGSVAVTGVSLFLSGSLTVFSGNLTVTGSVGVTNFPAVQRVTGTVALERGNDPVAPLYVTGSIFSTGAQQVTGSVSLTMTASVDPVRPPLAALTRVNASTSATLLLSGNSRRLGTIIFNDSPVDALLAYSASVSYQAFTYYLTPYMTLELPTPVYTGPLSAFWSEATGSARMTETSF